MLILPKGTNHIIKCLKICRFGGPTIVGEWSIADTDCALYVNAVGQGYLQLFKAVYKLVYRSRWEGTYSGRVGTAAGGPGCATGVGCSCSQANANSSDYSDTYKQFLSNFYIAQVNSSAISFTFRQLALNVLGDGFIGNSTAQSFSDYRTWDTENATQCTSAKSPFLTNSGSYKKLLAAGIVSLQHNPDTFNCSSPAPDYQALGLPETF